MKTKIFTALMLSSMYVSAAPLTIEPSRAFNEAYMLGLKAAQVELGIPDQPSRGVRVERKKNVEGRVADYRVELEFSQRSSTTRSCTAFVMILRETAAKDQQHILEEDSASGLLTVATVKVRCN